MMWRPDRNRHQGRIVAASYEHAAGVPCERKAVLAGGLRGAGKDAALRKAGIDRARYLTVSVEAVLAELARRSLIPVIAGLAPLEAADLVQAEAQHVAGRLAARALADGRNVLLDITMASEISVKSWLRALDLAAYTLDVVIADISSDEAITWSETARWQDRQLYLRGIGQGGRRVPPGAIREAALAGQAVASTDWTAVIGHLSRRRPIRFPGGEVFELIASYREGRLTLEDLGRQFLSRAWPAVPPICPPGLEGAAPAVDDPEPWIPGSFNETVLGYDLGLLSDRDYRALLRAVS